MSVSCLLFLGFTSTASAISNGYCEASLRGQTSLAPDNDAKQAWNNIEASTGRQLSSSYPISFNNLGSLEDVHVVWQFVFKTGGYTNRNMECWRELPYTWSPYHDRWW